MCFRPTTTLWILCVQRKYSRYYDLHLLIHLADNNSSRNKWNNPIIFKDENSKILLQHWKGTCEYDNSMDRVWMKISEEKSIVVRLISLRQQDFLSGAYNAHAHLTILNCMRATGTVENLMMQWMQEKGTNCACCMHWYRVL